MHCRKETCSTWFDMFVSVVHSCSCLLWNLSVHSLPEAWGPWQGQYTPPNSALCLHHAHPFVAASEKNLSHAEKQRVWSRSCGLQDLPQYSDCALSCGYETAANQRTLVRDWAFSKQWVGNGAASLSAANVRKMWCTAERRFSSTCLLQTSLPAVLFWNSKHYSLPYCKWSHV